jgi:hypothetical protein
MLLSQSEKNESLKLEAQRVRRIRRLSSASGEHTITITITTHLTFLAHSLTEGVGYLMWTTQMMQQC